MVSTAAPADHLRTGVETASIDRWRALSGEQDEGDREGRETVSYEGFVALGAQHGYGIETSLMSVRREKKTATMSGGCRRGRTEEVPG